MNLSSLTAQSYQTGLEFLLTLVTWQKISALHHVTEAYDMNGLTVRFNLTDPSVQKYKSTVYRRSAMEA
ncbi:MAG: hypothetical protein MZV63_05285 [Marinilabiliales bacterium]|nr:hypothetical protein [Marinilabiliales bacterium]